MYPGQQVTAPASPGLEVNRKLPEREALPLAGDRGGERQQVSRLEEAAGGVRQATHFRGSRRTRGSGSSHPEGNSRGRHSLKQLQGVQGIAPKC